MEKIKISVALCTFNGERYIEEQLKSILNQTVVPDEIIICDDNSKDSTVEIIERTLKNVKLEYILTVNAENVGVTKNFEQAIKRTTGDIIFLADQDDVWKEDKVEELIKLFNNSRCVMAYSDSEIIVNNKISKKKLWEVIGFKPTKNFCYEKKLLKNSLITGATMAVKKEFLNEIMPFPKEWIHDGWIAICAKLYGEVLYSEKTLMKYRLHNSNVVGATIGMKGRMKNYFKNIKTLSDERVYRYKRYKIFYKRKLYLLDISYQKEIEECIEFWADMVKLKNNDKLKSLYIIFCNLKRGNYSRFYTGFRGAIRDIIFLVVR